MTQVSDHDKLSGRIKRYGSLSLGVGEAMTKILLQRLLSLQLPDLQQAKIITEVLGKLKGPVMKVAQMLATIPDALPPEYAQELMSLQSNAPAMGWPFVKRRMQAELGPNWQSQFVTFDQGASAAASLGQIHQAISHSGQHLACKLQYPEMASTIAADLSQLKGLFTLMTTTSSAIDPENILQEIKQLLQMELDYNNEAININFYRYIYGLDSYHESDLNLGFSNQPYPDSQLYQGDPNIVNIPKVVYELSTSRLLTMDYLKGQNIKDLIDKDQDFRNRLARHFFITWYYPLYHFGVIHGDPHFGNYTVTKSGRINLFDFGCIRFFDHKFITGIFNLFQGLRHQKQTQIVYAYELWGFTNPSLELLEILNLWAQLFYEPLLDDRIRPLQDDHRGHHGRRIAKEVFTQLHLKGGVKPPREFVFMDRATVGVGSICMTLKAEINWHNLFQEIICGTGFEKYLT